MTRRIHILYMLLLAALAAVAQAPPADVDDVYEGWDEAEYMDMTFEENLATPALKPAEQTYVRQYMRAMARLMAKQGYTTDLDRYDEVVIVSIPLRSLFQPNDTLLTPGAPRLLRPLLEPVAGDPDLMKLVYAVHSDDTGSEEYNYNLSHERVNTLYTWLLDNINEDLIVIPFAMGDSQPLVPNNTMQGREENRRVEFYYIPGPGLISQARR